MINKSEKINRYELKIHRPGAPPIHPTSGHSEARSIPSGLRRRKITISGSKEASNSDFDIENRGGDWSRPAPTRMRTLEAATPVCVAIAMPLRRPCGLSRSLPGGSRRGISGEWVGGGDRGGGWWLGGGGKRAGRAGWTVGVERLDRARLVSVWRPQTLFSGPVSMDEQEGYHTLLLIFDSFFDKRCILLVYNKASREYITQ